MIFLTGSWKVHMSRYLEGVLRCDRYRDILIGTH